MAAIAALTGDNFGEIWSIAAVSGSALRPSSRASIRPAIPHAQGGFAGRVAPGPSGVSRKRSRERERPNKEAKPSRQANRRRRRFRMALPEFSMRQLLEAGAHFGHRTQRWNPKM